MFSTVNEYAMFSGPVEEEGAGSDAFQAPIDDIVALAPVGVADGYRIILLFGDNYIYERIPGDWEQIIPEEGWLVYVNAVAGAAKNEYYTYTDANTWVIAPKHLIHALDDSTVHTPPTPAVEDNIVTFNASGLPKDSGVAISVVSTFSVVLTDTSVNFDILAAHQFVGVETSAAAGHITLNLPTATTVGKEYIIADVDKNASVNNLIVTPDGADTIDTVNAAITYTTDSTSINIICYATGKWKVT